MRKAGVAIRGATKGRRKDKESSSSPQQSPTTTTGVPLTQEQVAAITAKNYRLAKELSELRVRHREECRNATRLSMDNINLASKCREAIKHAKALKAEVKAHRQRLRQLGELGTAAAASTSTSPTSTNASAVSPKSTMDDADDDDTLLLSSRSSEGDDEEEKKSEGQDEARQPPRRRPEHPTTATADASHVPILLQQPPPPPSAKLQAEMERMDRILAEHAQRDRCCIEDEEPQHLTPSLPTLRTNSSEEEEDGIAQPPQEEGGLYLEEPPPQPLETPSARDFDSGIGCSENGSPLISSDDFDEDVTDEEEDEQNRNHEDEAAADTEEDDEDAYDSTSPLADDNNVSSASDHRHHRTPSPSWETHFLPSPQFKFYDEEYPQDISSVSVRSSKDSADHYSNSVVLGGVQEEESAFGNGGPTPSSMDAFEASFNIGAFPESFSPREQERHPRDMERQQAIKNNGRTSPDAGIHRAPIRRDFTKSPPPQPILMDETKTEDPTTTSVYDPFTYSPRNDEVYRKSALPSQSRPDLEPLVIKWGTRARDRMRAASDPPVASFNSNYNKKLSVRQIVDLSSSSMEEPTYHTALTPPSSVGKIKDNAGSEVNNTTLSPRSVSSASATGSGGSPTKDKRSPPIWDGVRSMLPFNKSSPRKGAFSSSPQHDPSTPTQYHRNGLGGDVYSTPPSSAASSSMQSNEDSYTFEPKRPEKAGYDAARAKYEKATRPRPGKLDACASTSDNVMYSESAPVEEPAAPSSPSRNRQLFADAQLLASVSVKDRAAAFRVSPPRQDMPSPQSTRNSFSKLRTGPSYDDSDGDIPLNTSISRSQLQDDDDHPRSNVIYADRDDEFMPPQRPVWEEDDGRGTALFTVIREDTSRPYSPYELESQLKRRSPLGSDFALADATHEAASLV